MSDFSEMEKKQVIFELRCLLPSTPGLGGKVKRLREKFHQCGSCGHDNDKRLLNEFNSIADELFAEREKSNRESIRLKEDIIREAENLIYSDDLKGAKEKIKQLREKWKEIPRASKEDEEQLWKKLNDASERIYEKAKKDYEARQARLQEAKRIKESLVSQADSLSYSTDFRNAKEQMRSLQEQWKQAPRASKEDEDVLWERFRTASNRLFENANKAREEKVLKQDTARKKKESVIYSMEALLGTSDFRQASEEMKKLSDEFYAAGSAGKDNESLKERFTSVKNRFYEAKKQESERRKQEYIRNLQDRLFSKKESLSRLEQAIYRKQEQYNEARYKPEPSFNNPHRWEIISRRSERESQLLESIRSMEIKRGEIIDSICQLESKLNHSY